MTSNLLPETEQAVVRSEYRRRVIVAAGILAAFVLGANIALLLPPWLAFAAQKRELLRQKQAVERGALFVRVTEIESSIRSLNQNLRRYKAEDAKIVRSIPVLDAAIRNRGGGVTITTLVFTVPKEAVGGRARLIIGGNAESRAALLRYRDALAADPIAESVESPISNLLHEADVDFQITLIAKP